MAASPRRSIIVSNWVKLLTPAGTWLPELTLVLKRRELLFFLGCGGCFVIATISVDCMADYLMTRRACHAGPCPYLELDYLTICWKTQLLFSSGWCSRKWREGLSSLPLQTILLPCWMRLVLQRGDIISRVSAGCNSPIIPLCSGGDVSAFTHRVRPGSWTVMFLNYSDNGVGNETS